MNKLSYIRVSNPSNSFITLTGELVNDINSTDSKVDDMPPVKSSKIEWIDHPAVDLLFEFQISWGIYFKVVARSLKYPMKFISPNPDGTFPELKIYIMKAILQK